MKTCILKVLKVFAVLLLVSLVLELTPPLLDNTKPAWFSAGSFPMRHNFYFARRQWLADARTIIAGIRFLYQANSAMPTNSVNAGGFPASPPLQPGINTNLVATGKTVGGAPVLSG